MTRKSLKQLIYLSQIALISLCFLPSCLFPSSLTCKIARAPWVKSHRMDCSVSSAYQGFIWWLLIISYKQERTETLLWALNSLIVRHCGYTCNFVQLCTCALPYRLAIGRAAPSWSRSHERDFPPIFEPNSKVENSWQKAIEPSLISLLGSKDATCEQTTQRGSRGDQKGLLAWLLCYII